MLLWIVMAVLTAAASLTVLVPLYRNRVARRTGEATLSIYRDQLDEVERDLHRGLIKGDEAEAARTEIARRLIRADDAAAREASTGSEMARKLAATVAIAVVPAAALGLYLLVGSPALPDRPLAARLDAPLEQQDVGALIARVENHLAQNPEDGRGWELLGPVYVRLGRYDDAVRAFTSALRILGPTAEREANVGEAITRANGNVVTAEARAAFERARALDASAIRPRFYLAVALDQEGRKEEAITAWREILTGSPPDAPWAEVARQALARLEATPATAPGPDAADVAAAEALSPEERQTMIEGMVGSLAARLEADPSDASGWARLIRSYMVLGRKDDARAALDKARERLAGDRGRLTVVEAEARTLGLIE